MNFEKSISAFQKAQEIIPGGVNSPVRAFKSVKRNPVFIKSAQGAYMTDEDDNKYIDFVGSWGPLILGHSPEPVVRAIKEAAEKGTSYGAPTLAEIRMAEQIVKMVTSIDVVRMVNSGTEATMSALRLARGFTGRDIIIKFEGCYHGHADSFLIKAGSGAITFGLPDSPGVTAGTAKDTLVAEYNNIESVEKLFSENPDKIAAVIVEPVAGNMGVVLPKKGFLQALRDITKKHGALLIFDEVITGFRLAKGGAQEIYDVTPDLTTLGKIIGGGLPVGAYGGRRDIMQKLAPAGPVYQAGTLAGNPLAMAAGLAMLKVLDETPDFYAELERKADLFEAGIKKNLAETNVKAVINRVGSMMTLFFTELPAVESYADVMKSDAARYARFFGVNLENGVYLAPSQFEAAFISAAHTDEILKTVLEKNLQAFKTMEN